MNIRISTDNLVLSSEMLREVLAWADLSETEVHARLQIIFNDAAKYRRFHRKRHEKALTRSIRWGAEYDSYLQKHLAAGLRPKTAKTAAKRDFIAAHPLADANDTDEFPGRSNPALKRYHEAWRHSLQQ
jgi:hypothetical protein